MQASSEVLARKYRPQNFDELIGQESISQTLSLALDSNRLSHAYLFSGLRGSGKTSTARIFAKALLCEKGISHHPCGECQNCVMAQNGSHMDIIEMDAASSRKIDDIRGLIEQTKYKPAMGRFKIFIIDEVHMLTKEAFNALLKTLEEPPAYVKFILATTDPLKLPATILSRTQHFRFKKIAHSKVVAHLKYILELENIGYESEALEILARSGSGSLRDTLTLLDQAIIYSKGHVDVATVTDMLGLVDPNFLKELFSAIFAKDRAKVLEFIKELENYEAEMVVDELIAYLKERLLDGDGAFSPLLLDRYFRILSESKYLFSINADGGFVLGLIFFKMMEALSLKEIDALIEELESQNSAQVTPSLPQEKEVSSVPKEQVAKSQEESKKELFNRLIAKIKDRSAELGECFENSITFVSFEDGLLTWESCADEACKERLKHGYSVIKMLTQEIFGFGTKIKGVKCTKEIVQKKKAEVAKQTQPSQEAQSATMIEEAEGVSASSCVASCAGLDEPKQEIDNILEEPTIQKAIELFEAKKVIVQSKV